METIVPWPSSSLTPRLPATSAEAEDIRPVNSRLLRIQLRDLGMEVSDADWAQRDETAADRFERLMVPRLSGKRWALKEVLCEEHFRVVETLKPAKVLITVRDIGDVALSFFEKHRTQDNLDRFSDDWVVRYCVEESRGVLKLRELLNSSSTPSRTVRYEDVTNSSAERTSIAEFVGWRGGGSTSKYFAEFDRSFEVARHGPSVSDRIRTRLDRNLGYDEIRLSELVAERCADYQAAFGYC